MRRMLTVISLALVIACGPAVDQPAESTVNLTAPDGYAVQCATNFIRTVPHYCVYTGVGVTFTSGTVDNTCRSVDWVTTASIPSSTKVVNLIQRITVGQGNAVATRQLNVSYFNSTTCNVSFIQSSTVNVIREQTAQAAGPLGQMNIAQDVILVNGLMYYLAQSADGSSNHAIAWQLLGYYD